MPKRNKGAHLNWRQDRKVWEVRWFDRGRRRARSTGTSDRREAETQLAQHLIESEPAGPRDPSQRYIADVLTDYMSEHGHEVVSPAQIANSVRALLPFWGHLVVTEITEQTCRGYVRQRRHSITGEAVAAGTVRNDIIVLAAAIRHDFQQGRLTRLVHIWMPPASKRRERWLTRQEAASLIRAARNGQHGRRHLPLFILMGIYTAARKEAILSLRWTQVDFGRGMIDFRTPGREATSKGRAQIPIPRRLMTFLRYARRHSSPTGFVIQYNGKPIKDVRKGFRFICKRAGLDGICPHTLRHTAATWMVRADVPWWQIARYLGHTTTRQIEMTYGHHRPEWLSAAASSFDRRA